MRKTFRLSIILSFVIGASVSIADPPSKPTAPLVRRAPAFSSWTITFASTSAAPDPRQPPPQLLVDREQSITVTKTDHAYCEVITMKSGKKSERWISNGIQLITLPGSDQVCQVEHQEGYARTFDFSASDFDGLDWLSLGNYQGIKTHEGIQVFAFGPKSAKLDDKPSKDRNALLTVDTQLPLFTSDSNGTRTYTYNPPPTAALVPPDKFLKAFKQFGIEFK